MIAAMLASLFTVYIFKDSLDSTLLYELITVPQRIELSLPHSCPINRLL
jgi:hypothetical protein